jgi:hypothetical protein
MEPQTNSTVTNPSADVAAINKEMQDLYDTISEKIGLAVANGQFTVETFEVILAKVVETIEEFSAARATKLTGVEKRNLGINLVRMILTDLKNRGQISSELYTSFNMALTYVAPAIFAAAKIAWTKLQAINSDIKTRGCRGCLSRNF